MRQPQVCKHQVCDHCGGRFGMVTHRWCGNKFCKRACKDAYIRDVGLAIGRRFGISMLRPFAEASLGSPGNVQLALLIERRRLTHRKNESEL
jgi:hypothetical protein